MVGVPARIAGKPDPSEQRMDLQHGALPDPILKAVSESLDRAGRLEERVQQLEQALAHFPTASVIAQTARVSWLDMAARVRAALYEVIDPEAGINVVELGLIRDVLVEGDQVEVQVVLDNPHCPLVEYLVDQIRRKVKSIQGIQHVQITFLDESGGTPLARAKGSAERSATGQHSDESSVEEAAQYVG